jgi:hypothetical protein
MLSEGEAQVRQRRGASSASNAEAAAAPSLPEEAGKGTAEEGSMSKKVDGKHVSGPYSIKPASFTETECRDYGIVGQLPDGMKVVIGEIWVGGVGADGSKVILEADKLAQRVVDALNREA